MAMAPGRFLVADVGGTNSRLALSGPRGEPGAVSRFVNDDHDGFASVLRRFAADHDLSGLAGCCVAVAGPVRHDSARLTNRNWHFSPDELARQLPGLTGASVRLLNDLAALGYALPYLGPTQVEEIRAQRAPLAGNDQTLVAGLGTGFNICMVKGRSTVLEAELGHASLPRIVADTLRAEIGAEAEAFETNEALFSGRGLSRLFRVLSGGTPMGGTAVLAACEKGADGPAPRSVDLMARLLGVFSRELVYQYLPSGGLYFAGGAARGILGSPARRTFLHAFDAPGRFTDRLGDVAIRVILDDAAALTGAARLLAAEAGAVDQ